MKSKRFLCLLLVLLMVFSLTPSETRAETTVYFTAVNDQLLPDLSDETMPFWSGGRLYVPSTVITGTDLGLFYSRSRDKSTAVVYRQGSALTFNFAAGPSLTRTTASTAARPSCAATLCSCRSTF